ncbi:hypothetical protein DFA_00249 [Cavenderia fasciculata]|uniref:Uncharacterized protein n=1 Tax=Cavenderia fasciculata TaxID=261658 RepID=F4PY11_CACFS|nr:uncharacterized protein DFA_00249 [Cavenderia fasciculata]EGG19671.1 hypothetical protein DFA_00249 [Cavenderia fasciculata]|eukprot:XP_004357965.1 hypothetical protein DFA_00249 [Cavenderia fasciculata]
MIDFESIVGQMTLERVLDYFGYHTLFKPFEPLKEKISCSILLVGMVGYKTYHTYLTVKALKTHKAFVEQSIEQLKAPDVTSSPQMLITVRNLLMLANNHTELSKRLANREMVQILLNLSQQYMDNTIYNVRGTQPSETQFSTLFYAFLYSDISPISLVSHIIYYFDNIKDIPFEDILKLADHVGFPAQVLIGNMLATFLLINNHVVELYTLYKVHLLFFKLIKHEVGNEFLNIRQATSLLVRSIDRKEYTLLFAPYQEDALAMSRQIIRVPQFLINYSVNYRMSFKWIALSSLISFACGSAFGWKHHNGSIKHALVVGGVWGALKFTRWVILDRVETSLKDYPTHWNTALQAVIYTPFYFFSISRFTSNMLPEICYRIGHSLFNTYDRTSWNYRKRLYLQSDLYQQFKSRFLIDTAQQFPPDNNNNNINLEII